MSQTEKQKITTRFAPSPTGKLHLGHAYSAHYAYRLARDAGGRFLVRIEDIDASRRRPQFEAAIFEDLDWLGLAWEEPVRRQSERMSDYAAALARLDRDELLYPCFCTRRMIREEIAAIGEAPHVAGPGPDGPVYPGTCRGLTSEARQARIAEGAPYALRIDMQKALALAGRQTWHDRSAGEQLMRPEPFGDAVLARKDVPASYHLCVTIDDAAQGVTLVTRGSDLFAASHLHRLLQSLLGLPVPQWDHHALVADPQGRRMAKRSGGQSIADLRGAGLSAADVLEMAEAAAGAEAAAH